MTNKQNKVQHLIDLKIKINELHKKHLKQLEDEFDAVKVSLERDVLKTKVTKFIGEGGYIIRVDRTTKGRLDEKTIAVELGVEDLETYRGESKTTSFVQIKLN